MNHNIDLEMLKGFTGDMLAVTVMGAALLDYLPPIAAALTILYTAIRIWESKTVQGWLGKKTPPSED